MDFVTVCSNKTKDMHGKLVWFRSLWHELVVFGWAFNDIMVVMVTRVHGSVRNELLNSKPSSVVFPFLLK